MENKETNKLSKKQIIVIVSLLVAVLIIGVTIAYFMSRQTGEEQTITSGNLSITYTNENAFNLTGLIPLAEEEVLDKASKIEFTITNNGNLKAYVEIGMTDITIPNEFKNQDFMYAIYDEDNNMITRGDFSGIGSNTDITMYRNLEFNEGDSKNYTAYIWINETPEDQTAMMNKTFKGKMQITGYIKPTEYKDPSGANSPVLASGMIPVVYDNISGNWEVADTNANWYSYDGQKWANAVTTNEESYRTAEAGTEIPMDAINSMWVWIPRYKYRIPSNIGSSTNVTTPPEIDIVFENGVETTGSTLSSCPITSTSCYYTHPAFRDGSSVYKSAAYDQGGWDEELEGIWVGKFETSGDATTPTIKPDVLSLRSQNVSTQFDTSIKFAGGTRYTDDGTVTFAGNNTYGLTSSTNTHMMKNTEWGAVAYLSQSKYGKMGNPNYSGINKEIYINNSGRDTYTGRSGGSPSASETTYGSYSYDDKSCSTSSSTCTGNKEVGKGTGASTTGTIYGIYDMNGGRSEYTMGNWVGSVEASGFTASNLPGGSSESKYYEKYTGTDSEEVILENSIKGDATYETMNWYSDDALFVCGFAPWFVRSGGVYSGKYSGIFESGSSDGSSISGSFRTVLIP